MKEAASKSRRMFFQGFILHIHPRKIAAETLRTNLSFGLGGMAVVLVLMLFTTGILQLLAYAPDVTSAYDTVKRFYEPGSYSGWFRNIHYWSGNLLAIVALLHCCRVFFTGAIDQARRTNWYIGLLMLFLVLFANFSGYLLPWDQLAYWAVTIFTSMLAYLPFGGQSLVELLRGGSEVGQNTLSLFYSIHTGVLPFCLATIMIYHFWLIRKAGGLICQDAETPRELVPVTPHLLVREAALGLCLICCVLVFSALVDAPLDDIANPAMSPNPAKAAWFFLGFQELLMHLHPLYAVFILPAVFLLALLILPFWQWARTAPGVWFDGRDGWKVALSAAATGILLTSALIILDEFLRNNTMTATGTLTRGLYPTLLLLAVVVGTFSCLIRFTKLSRPRAVMAIFTFFLAALITLTITGIWLRGPGMKLLFFS